jgi:imidazolonepropionase-like amidohydrolase
MSLVLLMLTASSNSSIHGHVSPSADRTIAFEHVNVIPLDDERVLQDFTVVVRNEVISAVGPAQSTAIPNGARRIDGRGKYLMPGLVDMHVHINSLGDMLLYVASGVTTVRNMRGYAYHLRWRERIATGQMLGPTLYTTGNMLEGDSAFSQGSIVIRTRAGATRAVRAMQREGYDFVKVYVRLDTAAYAGVIAAGAELGIPVVGHIPWKVGAPRALAAHQSTIEHAENLYQTWFDSRIEPAGIPALADAARSSGVAVTPTLTVFRAVAENPLMGDSVDALLARAEMRYVEPALKRAWQEEALDWLRPERNRARQAQRFAGELVFFKQITAGLHRAGVPILAGTDSPSPWRVPGRQLREELRLYVEIGLTPYQALLTATRNPATVLQGRFGGVAPGAPADLLLLDANPLQDIVNLERQAGVVVRGRWYPQAQIDSMLEELARIYESRAPFESMQLQIEARLSAWLK